MKKVWRFLILVLLLAVFSANGIVYAQEPTAEPTVEATEEPTAEPTAEPTVEATEEPTAEPTAEPTVETTEEPTAEPTEEPTVEATEEPTAEPTAEPTVEATEEPTAEPTVEATEEPTAEPTEEPTEEPTPEPTTEVSGSSPGDIQAQANATYFSKFAVMNASAVDNQVSIKYYKEDGTAVDSKNYDVPQNLSGFGSVRITHTDIDDPASSFRGSAVINGTGDLASVVLVTDDANGDSIDMYSGSNSTNIDTTLLLPLVHRNLNNTWFHLIAIQNTNSSQNANVTVNFRTNGSQTVVYSETHTIAPFASVYIDTKDAQYQPLNDDAGTKWKGSVEIVSNVAIAANSIQYNVSDYSKAVHGSFTVAESGTKFFIPLLHAQAKGSGNGWNGWLTVLNVSGSPITVEAEFIRDNGDNMGKLTVNNLAPFNSHVFQGDQLSSIKNIDKWKGSVILTSNGAGELFVAEQTNANFKKGQKNYYLYKGSRDGSTATTLYYPFIEKQGVDFNYSIAQNVGTTNTDITYQYYNQDGTPARSPIVISNVPPGVFVTQNTKADGLDNFSGSLVVTADEPIEGYSTLCSFGKKIDDGFDVCGTFTAIKGN